MINKYNFSSAILAVLLIAPFAGATSITIFEDDFVRDSSHTNNSVGNGWVEEYEAQDSYVRAKDGKLRLRGLNGPEAYHAISTVGYTDITIEFEWEQANAENEDALNLFWMNSTIPGGWTTVDATAVWSIELSTYDASQGKVSVGITGGGEFANAAFGFRADVSDDNEQAYITTVKVTGKTASPSNVPDSGSTVGLLGLGFVGLVGFRRRFFK